jgi:hypothetical protein
MNARLLLRNSIQKTPVESMTVVSSMRVRTAHGNSFDHLVGDGKETRWERKAKCLGGLEIDDEVKFG